MSFSENKDAINISYKKEVRDTFFNRETGPDFQELKIRFYELYEKLFAQGLDFIEIRAKLMEFILLNAQVGINPAQRYADSFNGEDLIKDLRGIHRKRIRTDRIKACQVWIRPQTECGAIRVTADHGHLCPDWNAIMTLGFNGIIERLDANYKEENASFYRACKTAYSAMQKGALRLAEEAERKGCECASFLRAIATRAPKTLDEKLQMIVFVHRIIEFCEGTRSRNIGFVDQMLGPSYEKELKSGISEEEEAEKLSYFLYQLWAMQIDADLPMTIGGPGENRLSTVLVKVYETLDIYSPKIHVRVCDTTSKNLILAVFHAIRAGKTSFVFMNDDVVVKSLMFYHESREDAENYIPIGCYEPSAFGKETGASGAGYMNLAKAVEFALFEGFDIASGRRNGMWTDNPETKKSFEEFYEMFCLQLQCLTYEVCEFTRAWEEVNAQWTALPILSGSYENCVKTGKDALAGGAVYNNSGLSFTEIGNATDSLIAIKACYDGLMSIATLRQALKSNWVGFEKERKILDSLPRYGTDNDEADAMAQRIEKTCRSLLTDVRNARGGYFKMALWSIDNGYRDGAVSGASADGRKAGEPFSRNLCSVIGKDVKGVTALIHSASKIPTDACGNGAVLDIMVHPSAVEGPEGLEIMYVLLKDYFAKGGYALNTNIVSAETLKKAQQCPEEYSTLQVRLCGWNVYFNTLSRREQDSLIAAAEQH